MKNQQKLVLGILATDNKIDKTQFAQGLKILETLPAEDAGKLNWIAKEFTLTKDDILTAFERSKELTSKHGNAESAFLSLSLDSNPASDEEDKGEVSIKLPRTESEISIQKGPTRLSGKSAYQTPESIGESKIKHAPKLKKQQIFGQDSSRFIDLDDSVVSEDEGLFKSSDSERPLSDIKPPSGVKPKLKRGSSKIIEPKKIVPAPGEKLILDIPPPIEEKQKKAFELEQIQSEEVLKDDAMMKPPPRLNPQSNSANVNGYDDVELESIDEIDEIEDIDEVEEISPAPPALKTGSDQKEIIEVSDAEIDEIISIDDFEEIEQIDDAGDDGSKSNRLRPRARRHRRK